MEENCLICADIWSKKSTKYIKCKKKRKSKIPPFFHSGSKLLIVWGLHPPHYNKSPKNRSPNGQKLKKSMFMLFWIAKQLIGFWGGGSL